VIEEQNPWWLSPGLISENECYKKYQQSKGKWEVELPISLQPYSLNFLFGPRQVGKSTALILLVKSYWRRVITLSPSFTSLATNWLIIRSWTRFYRNTTRLGEGKELRVQSSY
jgi:predicted AAA+ superfamily ATPase